MEQRPFILGKMAGSKKQVFYIHGGMAFSKYESYLEHLRTVPISNLPGEGDEDSLRWSQTLQEDLGEEYEVFAPTMPNKYNAKYEEWKIWFERHFEYLGDNITLLGWSQGAYFLEKYLIENTPPFSVKNLMLVAPPFEPDNFGGEDGGDFAFDTSVTSVIQEKVENIVIFHSKDDFVVPFSHGERLAEALPDAEFMVFHDKNHFLIEEFPELIEKIKAFA